MRFPVHSDMAADASFPGTKKPGDIVVGRKQGDWVALTEEPGFMRVLAVGTGKQVLTKLGADESPAMDVPEPVQESPKPFAATGDTVTTSQTNPSIRADPTTEESPQVETTQNRACVN